MYSPCGVKALHGFAEVLVYNADDNITYRQRCQPLVDGIKEILHRKRHRFPGTPAMHGQRDCHSTALTSAGRKFATRM